MLTHSSLSVNLRDTGVWIDLLAAIMTTSAKALQLSLIRTHLSFLYSDHAQGSTVHYHRGELLVLP